MHSTTARLAAAALAASLVASPAAAQDTAFDWSGLFVGVTGGGAAIDVRATDTGTGPFGPWYVAGGFADDTGSGLLGGVRTGYNYAFGNVVLGVEADISATNITQIGTTIDLTGTTDINWFATVRGRAGLAVPDTGLPAFIYGTGGLAVAGIEHSIADTSTTPFRGLLGPTSDRQTRTGYTVGGGIELAFSERVVVGVEYLYTDFGTASVNGICVVCFGGGTPGTPYVFDYDTSMQTIRANLTWKFGG
ncbi:MAG: outer membrane beta-barrel protein [Roseitalea porphyridii]|jgi:outer membrane immunogenic protein|uniref:outer membrane protein n=1 Tax=Alphaproteobacteria TaxID=28211 RepID=UPI0032EEE97F